MALRKSQSRYDVDEPIGREVPRSHWTDRLWGCIPMACGLLLIVCLSSFRLEEISWDFLNETGIVVDLNTNVLGVFGLYLAGLLYWCFGIGTWFLAVLLEWIGFYRILRGGDRIKFMWYAGGVAVTCACIFIAVQPWAGRAWAETHAVYGPGGAWGYLLGVKCLRNLMGTGGTLALSFVVYSLAFIYAVALTPKAIWKGLAAEYVAFRKRRRSKREAAWSLAEKKKALEEEEKRERSRKKFSELKQELKEEIFSHEKKPAVIDTDAPVVPRPRKRTGDPLEILEEEVEKEMAQQQLPLTYTPKIFDSNQMVRPTATPPARPASSLFPAQGNLENYVFPPYELMKKVEIPKEQTASESQELVNTQNVIVETLKSFGLSVTPGNITKGPTITRYEVYPAPGLRVNRITNLKDDLARAVKAVFINILAPIPGKDTVGIEIANDKKVPVSLRTLLEDPGFTSSKKKIPIALGKDVYGNTVIGDLAAMPHLLVAGTTGSGKSVCINSIITSILYRFRPDELKFILVDPKVVEMEPYSRLPHLIVPVVTDPKKVVGALRWCVNEMEHRYGLFKRVHVRNFESFNSRPKDAPLPEEEEEEEPFADELLADSIAREFESQGESPASVWEAEDDDPGSDEDEIPDRLPYIVVIIDELADLMQTAPADTDGYIGRLTQKARAAGIHLIVATQTPRSNVVTGLIKANIPSRIAFQVSSSLDSRIILDQGGAENLVGKGDLLFLPPGSAKLERAQGAFVSDEEVEAIVAHCSKQAKQQFLLDAQQTVELGGDSPEEEGGVDPADEETFEKCVEVVRAERKASTSLLQRRLRIGYSKAARMMELLEARRVIAPSDGTNRPREVLIKPHEE